jgi:N-acylneuraminate cytidylyltransferase
MKIAVIPARGGSKRIPQKNIKIFCGKPIIAWSIEAAKQSKCFDRVIVSTDDERIASIARQYGAEVPFIRPSKLSDDYTETSAVVSHAIEKLKELKKPIDLVCCIYATAPFIRPNDLKDSLVKLQKLQSVDYCFSVTNYSFPIQRSIRITKDDRCEMLQPSMFNSRSQDLEAAYHDAGQFYWGRVEAWSQKKPLFSLHSTPYILPHYRVQDIDTLDDWKRAELIMESLLLRQENTDSALGNYGKNKLSNR